MGKDPKYSICRLCVCFVIGNFRPKQFSCNFFFVNIQDKLSPHGCFHCATEEYVTVLSIAARPGHHHGYVHGQSKTSVLALLSSSELATWWALNDLISFHPGISIRHYSSHPRHLWISRYCSESKNQFFPYWHIYCSQVNPLCRLYFLSSAAVIHPTAGLGWVLTFHIGVSIGEPGVRFCLSGKRIMILDHFGGSTRDSVTGSLSDRYLFVNVLFPRYSP